VPATSGSLTSTTSAPAAQEACGIRVSPGPSNHFRDVPLASCRTSTVQESISLNCVYAKMANPRPGHHERNVQ
jgi:hypothetical protein